MVCATFDEIDDVVVASLAPSYPVCFDHEPFLFYQFTTSGTLQTEDNKYEATKATIKLL